jgi:O-antigen ligase
MERLTFNVSSAPGGVPVLVVGGPPPGIARRGQVTARLARIKQRAAVAVRERADWDYLWVVMFTCIVFFRPQDHFLPLAALHLADVTAIAGLTAMAARRMRAGEAIAHVNAELIAIVALGGVILLTIPFSFWPGGSLQMFSDVYVKIVLIFALMVTTVSTPRRVRHMTWIMIVACGYLAARAVFDYARGVNLIEGSRVRGAVGGMFGNPNDLAMNLVVFLGPALVIVLQDRGRLRRLLAGGIAVLMLAAIVCTKSRAGFVGLLAVGLVFLYYAIRLRPGVMFAVVLTAAIAIPNVPSSFWDRMDSIFNPATDPTGSRQARVHLLNQGLQVFLQHPITGIGAGQFVNYDGPEMIERWRVTHNVWLQVAAELGILGLLLFGYLVYRGFRASLLTRRLLTHVRRRMNSGPVSAAPTLMTAQDLRTLEINSRGMFIALVGWLVCAMFASIAFNWTFYYVLALIVAGREITVRRAVAR